MDYSWLLTHDSPMPDPLNVYLLELSDLGDPVTTPISSVTVRDPFSNRAVKHRHRGQQSHLIRRTECNAADRICFKAGDATAALY